MYSNNPDGSPYTPTLILPRMEKVQWMKDRGFSWSTLPQQHIYPSRNERYLSEGMKLAWDGMCGNSAPKFDHFCVYAS